MYSFQNQFNNIFVEIGNGDIHQLIYVVLYISNFGILISECTGNVFRQITFKTQENNY